MIFSESFIQSFMNFFFLISGILIGYVFNQLRNDNLKKMGGKNET